ncbi:NAD-dependent succinate-semialdehyde dehydrogenase [Thermus scotoductus]|uniref:NAD-dependent succinate-semialdehyde dehydrogenase n=3 Tax=Thermus scotoductus TaxID=37636 RepID=A0A430S3T4_THESC|nr:NAD-dependent succinate-semialdehyde dehydrogenase [Thermus scotoductus]RTH07377.1 NAD-dependent succinate-semialdehyde dehydrogenase [Thermus scotoductus]RTH28510.1 NAD-dependent succinate-semialdehyde dehydrogenase [Thermus scotoductus]RTI42783.1 NAD-dependent succinate-semialdehyde dehydrogenase [Thermus scotoductus]
MFIGGKETAFPELERFPVINPATGERVDTVPLATEREVDLAVRAAHEAFPAWWATPAARRGEILYAALEKVKAHGEELARTLTLEQGKPIREARLEIRRFLHTIEHYAGLAKNLRGGYVPNLDENAYGLVLKRPLGVVAAIVPWNFPTTLLANKLGPALVTGNTVVAKPAETTPLTTLRIAALFHEAGLPPGVFNVVTGLGPVAGEALVRHPLVRKVAFTGSTPVGKRIMALAAETLKRVTLELGGSDPMIVCDDADLDQAAKAAAVGRFFNCGQACLAVKRLYVFENVYEAFMERFLPRVQRLRLGPGLEEGTQMGPLHTERQRRLIEEQLLDALASGGRLLTGGKRPEAEGLRRGFFFEPTVVLEPGLESRVAQEEVFGPLLPVWRVRSLEEAVELANRSPYGLGSTVFTRSLERASYALERLEAGYTWVNSVNRIYDELPFGGTKQSGYGKEHGLEALEFYQETKAGVVRWG